MNIPEAIELLHEAGLSTFPPHPSSNRITGGTKIEYPYKDDPNPDIADLAHIRDMFIIWLEADLWSAYINYGQVNISMKRTSSLETAAFAIINYFKMKRQQNNDLGDLIFLRENGWLIDLESDQRINLQLPDYPGKWAIHVDDGQWLLEQSPDTAPVQYATFEDAVQALLEATKNR